MATKSKVDPDRVAVEDIRELEEDVQNTLLHQTWPFPIQDPACNTTGIECAVLVLRQVLRTMPTDSHCRAVLFGEKDRARHEVGEEELGCYRALFRYVWHHLPDLEHESVSKSPVLRYEVMDRQRDLLRDLDLEPGSDQSHFSFEALMESELMLASFWGSAELQVVRNVVGWQEAGQSAWNTRERAVQHQPIDWDGNQEPSLEKRINKMFGLREVNGGSTCMMLPNWPRSMRVKMTNSAPVLLAKVKEQTRLHLTGFNVRPGNETGGSYTISETHVRYRLAVAVVMRSFGDGDDFVYTFDSEGEDFYPLSKDIAHLRHVGPVPEEMPIKMAMLYYHRLDNPDEAIENRSISGHGEFGQSPGVTDDQRFRERLKALDPSANSASGFTPVSKASEARLPKNIAPDLSEARRKFFAGYEHLLQ
ncbi:hypothetical protein KVR01_013149 [Diaporthe batatas]|uniref:uncharacterized protein n=1 Tax=Diaporthe batatas TaxID=748121 RepID=UPI001D038032|nr:uncharacterized protein KVR01_013149 [Diaporthe batatas]KAG8156927.1 hypothetical protein KVR01_013149 [Diaporthe batatas]